MSKPATRTQSTRQMHVACGQSGGGSLRMALRTLGRENERIAILIDTLNLGPIAPATPRERLRWFDEELEVWTEPDAFASDDAFWLETVADIDPIVWMSRHCAGDVCMLLELLWRRRRPVRVVDVADADELRGYRSFASVSDKRIVELGLLERARRLEDEEVDRHIATWLRIKADVTPLRIVSPSGLVSVPLTHFDDAIVATTPTEWKRCAWVVGETLGRRQGNYYNVDDVFVWSRILALVDKGRLEGRGDFSSMRTSDVRRPRAT